MLDIDKCKEILENYFANVTQEQFAIDLEKYCPELVETERDRIDDSCLVVSPILDRVSSLEENRYQP
jgi:hypothetical protein